MNNDVDVNVLINVYNQRISTLMNQNVILEAKIQSLIQSFSEEKNLLLMKNLDLQQKIDLVDKEKKPKKQDKSNFEESGVE
jgi:hypothetical protein